MREYTEKEYWDGLVPDNLFDEYLKRYGYEYTPLRENNASTKLEASQQEGEEANS
tara:strand:+ start:306 stop:470 length:165 start_codon:yes stop_codon:yes gene_type:complete